jgi:hypothetical protein
MRACAHGTFWRTGISLANVCVYLFHLCNLKLYNIKYTFFKTALLLHQLRKFNMQLSI